MKKIFVLALITAGIQVNALPTYEPFTEYAGLIATSGSNSVNLALSGYTVTNGPIVEQWGGGTSGFGLFFSGTAGTGNKGNDIIVTNNPTTVFTAASLATLVPPGFPGAGGDINITAFIPSNATNTTGVPYTVGANQVGNSAVLKFAQPVVRPTSGVKTVYVSYLLDVIAAGATGAGNDGRYACFLSSTNLYEGTGSGGAFLTFSSFFNTFTANVKYYALAFKASSPVLTSGSGTGNNLMMCDSSAGNSTPTGSATVGAVYNTPNFCVGAVIMNAAGSGLLDTNIMWVNPSTNTFGGNNPPLTNVVAKSVVGTFAMSDLAGFCLIDRVGSGASGGIAPTYIGNLLIGTTWSYVTGGPEFTNTPANVVYSPGSTYTFTGKAVAAAQSVTYQWQRIVGGVTNNLTDGVGTAGGAATISGSTTSTLTIAGVSAGDVGLYQLVATASGTGLKLATPAQINTDPNITTNPGNVTANYGANATFTAAATSLKPSMSYQWYFGSTPLTNGVQADGSSVTGAIGTVSGGSLSTTLTISNVSYLEAGNYSVQVTNNVDFNAISLPGVLTVNDPYIVVQPNDPHNPLVLAPGGSGTVTITAAGSGLTYQWYGVNQGMLSDGGDLSGTTTSTLTISGAQYSDADNYYCIVNGSSGIPVTSQAQPVYVEANVVGPFDASQWPPTAAPNANVDFVVFDPGLYSTLNINLWPPSGNVMSVTASGGDQTWVYTTINGGLGKQMTGSYLNLVDPNYRNFTNVPAIDILVNVFGNSSFYNATNGSLTLVFQEGTTADIHNVNVPSPSGLNNGQWNWVLFSITNVIDINNKRSVGDPTYNVNYGGINGGTIRIYQSGSSFTLQPVIVRAVAMGPKGSFGSASQINQFAPSTGCNQVVSNNLAWIDFNLKQTNNLSVLNNATIGETYTGASNIGPTGDKRTAILPSSLMEMPILGAYLGLPCNPNKTMEIGLEVYDDPALTGSSFGPTTYATDTIGDLATYTGAPYTLTGSGQWIKVAFYVGPLNLSGVNTAPSTGGPIIQFNGSVPYIDRVEVGVIQTGTNPLAGQIPDPSYRIQPLVCITTNWGYYAEWNPSGNITNNVDISGGYVTALAGPVGDQRVAEVGNPGTPGVWYNQWALLNQAFGPNFQDNADVIIKVTYYDDPALVGSSLFPNAYSSLINGSTVLISPSSPYNTSVTLTGSGQWKDATFELPNVNFQNGVGQSVCRFAQFSSTPISVSRVRFDVMRPCGAWQGIDYLQSLGMNKATNSQIKLNWLGQAALQSAPAVSGTYNNLLSVTNSTNNIYTTTMTNSAQFFRLRFPGYPTNLSTSPIYP